MLSSVDFSKISSHTHVAARREKPRIAIMQEDATCTTPWRCDVTVLDSVIGYDHSLGIVRIAGVSRVLRVVVEAQIGEARRPLPHLDVPFHTCYVLRRCECMVNFQKLSC